MKVRVITPPALLLLSALAGADGGAAHKSKQSTPIQLGCSGGSLNDRSSAFCCGGTLGALVVRNGVVSILSNNHVLGRSGSAAVGEDTVHPGLIDTGCNAATSHIVGDYPGNYVPLGSANVDTALTTVRSGMVDTSGAILDVGVPSQNIRTTGLIGLGVQKSGRTTGRSTGTITATNASVSIQYQKGCNSGKKFTVSFTNQIVTGDMSDGGDSGSLTVSNDASKNPVGLLFAGSSTTTIHNPIGAVVSAYQAGGNTFSFVGTNAMVLQPPKTLRAPSPEDLELALQVKLENETEFMKKPGVLGIGIGQAEDNPLEAAIVVLFDRSQVLNLPPRLDGFQVRYILTDTIVAQNYE